MRQLLLSIIILICTTSSMAQELSVRDFREVTNDLSARTSPRQDLNGKDCALVKVQIASPGVTFTGNVMGDVNFKNNVYWVYMTDGSKRLTVNHPSYLPLEVSFEDYGVSKVNGKTTYALTVLLGDLPQGVQQKKVQTGWILLDSEPAGASVYINDEFVGNTPLDGYKQPYGTYSYRLEMPDYHPASGTLELNSSRLEKNIKLVPAFGAIAVNSNIGGATVLLDGKAVGSKTPCTLQKVASGQHTITLQKDKYAPRQENVTVEDGKTTTVNVNLDARFATITITSLEGAQIWSNGKQIGTTKCQEDMMEGFYDLEVKLPHHRSATKQIQVIVGQPQQIALNPTPIYGSLDITSTPRDADVTIDGKAFGKTPTTIEQLLEGSHQVVVSKQDFQSQKTTIIISENETESLSLPLKKIKKEVGKLKIKVKGVTFNMIRVEAGTFQMGSTVGNNDEKIVHQVTLTNDYYIGETEVTQELWTAVMGSNPSIFKSSNKLPVEKVSWDDCQLFITKLNKLTGKTFRLPTEAEWEFAARGGNASQRYTYSGSNNADDVAWYYINSGSKTNEVATKAPNELGIYDMSGNVWEWCQDWYGNYNSGAQTNPTGPASGSNRVDRGGSWDYFDYSCRVSIRSYYTQTDANSNLGLRLAL